VEAVEIGSTGRNPESMRVFPVSILCVILGNTVYNASYIRHECAMLMH